MTFFFHLVPGFTETFTRFPTGAPLFANPDDPALQRTIGVVFLARSDRHRLSGAAAACRGAPSAPLSLGQPECDRTRRCPRYYGSK